MTPPAAPGAPAKPDPRPLQQASREEILDRIRRSQDAFTTLESAAALAFTGPLSPSPQICKAHLVYEKPGRIFLRAYRELVPNYFTLAAGRGRFFFHVPQYNTVYTGTVQENAFRRGFEMDLDPFLLERSFLALPAGAGETAQMEEAPPEHYLLSLFKTEGGLRLLVRKLWISRRDLLPDREITYSPQGIAETEFRRSDYRGPRAFAFPRVIEIRRLKENKIVRIELENPHLNMALQPERFDYEPPAGAVIEEV